MVLLETGYQTRTWPSSPRCSRSLPGQAPRGGPTAGAGATIIKSIYGGADGVRRSEPNCSPTARMFSNGAGLSGITPDQPRNSLLASRVQWTDAARPGRTQRYPRGSSAPDISTLDWAKPALSPPGPGLHRLRPLSFRATSVRRRASGPLLRGRPDRGMNSIRRTWRAFAIPNEARTAPELEPRIERRVLTTSTLTHRPCCLTPGRHP